MLVAIGAHDPLCPGPLFDRPVLSEGFELPLPEFSIHERSGIGPDQTLASAFGSSPHADLSNIVLNPDDVSLVFAVNVLNANISPQHGFAQLLIGANDCFARQLFESNFVS